MIRQILSNSLKYSEDNMIEMNGKCTDQHIVLEIKDYGRGISKKDMPRILKEVTRQQLIEMKRRPQVWVCIWLIVLNHN